MSTASTRTGRRTIALALVISAVGATGAHAGTTPQWRHALEVRSTALNETYHLGRFAVPASAATNAKPAWLEALEMRSRALNRRYTLGEYKAPRRGVDVKKYAAIGVALAAMLAALVAAGVLVRRHTHRTVARVPKSA
ncbi:MAG TPA: hypothetical protein VGF66_00060 [Gaiellaceae bacterium]|jgi:hypothetical protein